MKTVFKTLILTSSFFVAGCVSQHPVIKSEPKDDNVKVIGAIETPEIITRNELVTRMETGTPKEQRILKSKYGDSDIVSRENINLTIGNKTINTMEIGGIDVFECSKSLSSKPLVIVGQYPDIDFIGFILFDGTKKGLPTLYERRGLDKVWSWSDDFRSPDDLSEESKLEYMIVINPSGGGMYYDFTGVEVGESTTPKMVFSCDQTTYK
jgi:hypothetical protein